MFADKLRWNKRFTEKPRVPPTPPEFVVQCSDLLSSGRVLDVASGDGAVALYLAAQGAQVTALDISDVALERLASFAAERALNIKTYCLDLDEIASSNDLAEGIVGENYINQSKTGYFDTVTMAYFKPSTILLSALADLLCPNGYLLLTTFNMQHHTATGFSQRFCLQANELVAIEVIDPRLTCVNYQSVNRNGKFMDDYLFQKKEVLL